MPCIVIPASANTLKIAAYTFLVTIHDSTGSTIFHVSLLLPEIVFQPHGLPYCVEWLRAKQGLRRRGRHFRYSTQGDHTERLRSVTISPAVQKRPARDVASTSRDHPACSRCSRQQFPCTYPLPPDRKLIASSRKISRLRGTDQQPRRRGRQTVENGNRLGFGQHSPSLPYVSLNDSHCSLGSLNVEPPGVARETGDESDVNAQQRPLPSSRDARIASVPVPNKNYATYTISATQPAARLTSCNESSANTLALLPPLAIGLSLLEIYFERIYNASLLFHKPTLFREYMEDKLPSFLVRSIFALSSFGFLYETNKPHRRGMAPAELSMLSSYHKNGRHWAQAAGQEVLTLADQPSLITSQTFLCLTFYWFADGQTDRATINLTLAYRACCILKYNQQSNSDFAPTSPLPMEHDLKRRCLWAAWATSSIASEPRSFATCAWSEVANVPLPRTSPDSGASLVSLVGQKMDEDWRCSTYKQTSREKDESPIWAEIMKIVGVWVKIQILATESSSYSDDRLFREMAHLSRTLKSISQSDSFSRWMMPHCSTIDHTTELRIFLTSLCHVCHIILHGTVVPLFSGRSFDVARTPVSTRNSGDTILEHAAMVGRMLQQYLSTDPDLTKLSPLVGFVAFISGSVLAISARSQKYTDHNEQSIPFSSEIRLIEACLVILDTLRTYWKPLQSPRKLTTYNFDKWEMLQHTLLAMKRVISPCQDGQASYPVSSEDRPPAQHTAALEGQADTSFITRYFSHPQKESIPRDDRGPQNISRPNSAGSTNPAPMSHSKTSSTEQAAHQNGHFASVAIPELEAEGYDTTFNKDSMTESVGGDYWLQFLSTSSWQDGEGQPPYEPLLPLNQQFF
ncbi:hypothetical protein GQ44DRAFT_734467 [Phaeosphaeriaceae sp. PMI808]|nr:hypothetical protein GQ44DRAFT_734467 [Phaeosphaeriaceae sp. PMI808]